MKLSTVIKRKTKINELIVFVVIMFIGGLFEFVGWFSSIRSFGQKYSIPIISFQTKIISQVVRPYNHLVFTINKSKYFGELETKYAQSLADLTELDRLRQENEELKKILSVSDRKLTDSTLVGAPIVSLASPAVGVGLKDGVLENNMVLVDQVLVGIIESVGEYQSKVSLFSSKKSKKVIAKTQSGVEGIIEGDGKNVLMTHVPRNAEVNDGERVVTVGQEGIEKNILIGVIRKIDNNPSDSTQTFVVSQLVSFYEAVLVEVR